MFDVFTLPFVQRGVWEILLLAVGAGLIGTWIVLRGLAFYAHAVGTATFPGLVLADGLGFATALGAAGTGALVAIGVGALARGDRSDDARERYDATTALVLCGALALGVILASDVFESGTNIETLLFGSLLVIDDGDLVLAAAASAVTLVCSLLLGPRWVLSGFDPAAARALGARSAVPDIVLLALVALVAVSVLSAVGALLATALIVVPAATTRLLVTRLRSWQLATIALVALEGVGGLWLSVETNAPPGATIAVLGGIVFVAAALLRAYGPRRVGAVAVAGALVAGVAGCHDTTGASEPDRVTVVATTTQLADMARAVGGDDVRVVQLLQPNSDPHEYEPRPHDLRVAADAKLMIVSGDGLDAWAKKVAEQAGIEDEVVDVGKGRPVTIDGDPHWWQDPSNAAFAASKIALALVDRAHQNVDRVKQRGVAYVAAVGRLDREIAACLRRVPAAQRKLVSDHDAFGYFARRYDIAVIGAVIPATTTKAQASAGELSALARTVQRAGVRAIFPESSLNPRLAEAVARRTGATVGGTLYADSLGAKGTRGATYLGSMRANADAVARGLTGGKVSCG
jgi:ABC-type Zn uptake system ZnuABC Zn-binding protein ZnuA/ABC-type Mn2+/Zn2+ transport system permease subunit